MLVRALKLKRFLVLPTRNDSVDCCAGLRCSGLEEGNYCL